MFSFNIKDDVLYLSVNDGVYLPNTIRVCSKEEPIAWITTNNVEDISLMRYLPKLDGAKLMVNEVHTNYDYDPYGRRVQRGTRPFQKWDLSAVFAKKVLKY